MSLLCPSCRIDLVMSDRNGVEIDYCPKCRGVWLDRGELDKIIERMDTGDSGRSPRTSVPGGTVNQSLFGGAPAQRHDPSHNASYGDRRETHRRWDDDDDDDYKRHPKARRKNWLAEIFD